MISSSWYMYARTLAALVQADLVVFRNNFWGIVLDNAITLFTVLIIMGSILPHFGLNRSFGPFMLGGLIASSAFFAAYGMIASLVSDITGDRKMVSYDVTLPVPSWLALTHIIISLAIRSIVISWCMIFLGTLFLWGRISLAQVSFLGCFCMIIANSLFCAAFGLWVATLIRNMYMLSSIWTRIMFPLWMFGGFQFSWAAMHAVFPWASYVVLFNPLLYTTEGMRNALLGSTDTIAWTVCVPLLLIGAGMVGWWGIYRLQKRLDFV